MYLRPLWKGITVGAAGLFVVASASAAGATPSGPHATHTAKSTRTTFSADITNPYFPLTPGKTLVYRGVKDGKPAVDYFATTSQRVPVNGVPCRLVLDRLFLDGHLAETTADYFTQDSAGNVHYYGEDTAKIDATGHMETFGTSGTWHAAEFGAIPGIFMPATQAVGATYRQEFLKGHAEDHFQILNLSAEVSVPYGSFDKALQTKEWTPLEPTVLDNKYFVKGIGMVKEIAVKGPLEELSLVDIQTESAAK